MPLHSPPASQVVLDFLRVLEVPKRNKRKMSHGCSEVRTPLNPLYSDGGEADVQHKELILRTNDWNNQAYRRALLKTMMQRKSFLQLVIQASCS